MEGSTHADFQSSEQRQLHSCFLFSIFSEAAEKGPGGQDPSCLKDALLFLPRFLFPLSSFHERAIEYPLYAYYCAGGSGSYKIELDLKAGWVLGFSRAEGKREGFLSRKNRSEGSEARNGHAMPVRARSEYSGT